MRTTSSGRTRALFTSASAFAALICAGASITAIVPAGAASNEISVAPSPAAPGQAVVLHWLFTGSKVVLSGGRFGKGVVVTGRTYAADHPHQTTRYTFDIWYTAPVVDRTTGRTVQKQLHSTYYAVAQVEPALAAGLNIYRDHYGWQVGYLPGWKYDVADGADPKTSRRVYFQQEDDSVERLAVSVTPAAALTCKDLMGKVQQSLSGSYDEPLVMSDTECNCAGVQAVESVFTGIDQSHPGTRTQSVVLAFVKDGRGFVVSARCAASNFVSRRPLLERMVKSIAVAGVQAAR